MLRWIANSWVRTRYILFDSHQALAAVRALESADSSEATGPPAGKDDSDELNDKDADWLERKMGFLGGGGGGTDEIFGEPSFRASLALASSKRPALGEIGDEKVESNLMAGSWGNGN